MKIDRLTWPILFALCVCFAVLLRPAPVVAADVSGATVTVSADATDNVGVVGVRFLLNGTQVGSEDTAAPYSILWDSTTVPDGTYTLRAEARDAAGNVGISAPVAVTVANSGGGGDATPPTVQTTSPANGATVGSTVSVTANATDNVGVVGVQFLLDGAPLGAEDTTAPYSVSWNTTLVANGAHTLAARARDAAGNLATSAAIAVTVNNVVGGGDTTPPTVQTTGPANGATVGSTVSVTASASDNVGVGGVQFFLDGALLGAEDTSAPYSVSWNTTSASDGSHVLSSRARDAAGNQTTSAPVTVTVDNTPPEEDPPASGSGMVDLSVTRTGPGMRRIHAQSDSGNTLSLHIEGQEVASVGGRSLDYDWDVSQLLGSFQIEAFATTTGGALVASASMFYDVASVSTPTMSLEVVEFPIIGATFIQGTADVGVTSQLELYIDGELVLSKVGSEINYAWDPGGQPHAILFVALDGAGVVGSVSVHYVP